MVAKIAIFTEADGARTQRCCGPEGCGYHNDQPYPARWCVGASCMAWRWYETSVRNNDQSQPNMRLGPNELVLNGDIYGYCGLAAPPSPRRSTTPTLSETGDL